MRKDIGEPARRDSGLFARDRWRAKLLTAAIASVSLMTIGVVAAHAVNAL